MENLSSADLKTQVRAHWEAETCGTRYGNDPERLEYLRSIAQARYNLEPFIHSFANWSTAQKKHVLEIGVGAGSDCHNWCRHAEHVTGMDLTNAAIELTRSRLQLENIPDSKYELLRADAEQLPFANASFDIVYSWGVLHHTPNTATALKEVLRVLKPGGTFKVMVYQTVSFTTLMLWVRYALLKGQLTLSLKDVARQHLESPGTKLYSPKEFSQLLTKTGFRDIQVQTRLGPSDLLKIKPSDKYQSRLYRLIWALYPSWMARLMGDRFGLYLMAEAKA